MENFDGDIIKFGFEGEQGISEEIIKKYGKVYKEKEIIFHERDKSDEIFYILKGRCWVTMKMGDTYKVLNILRKGEIFGEMAVFDSNIRSATVIAMDNDTTCLVFPKEDFIEIFKLHPRWVDQIINEMSRRIILMIEKL